jgi:hypothetical protein
MQRHHSFSFLAALAAAALLTGCGSSGVGGDWGRDRYPDGGYRNGNDSSLGDVRGTVERVDPRSRYIVVNREDDGRYDLRNGRNGRDDRGFDENVIYYDERTTVEHEGRTYRVEDLERGDRIAAGVERSGDRLIAEQIEVLYDVSRGDGPNDPGTTGTGSGRDGSWDTGPRDSRVRGIVRSVDTRNRTLEIDRSRYRADFSQSGSSGAWSDVILVSYDDRTTVEFEGRSYRPENIERGDEVEIQLDRDLDRSRLLARQILVVGDAQSRR